MNGLGFLMIAVVLSVLGSLVLLLRQRKPTSVDHAVDQFRKEMRALAPDDRSQRRPGPGSGP